MDSNYFHEFEPISYLIEKAKKTDIELVYLNKEPDIIPDKPVVFLIIGPGGSGKDTVTKPLINDGTLLQSRTATTRDCRVDEGESFERYVWMRKKTELESDDIYLRSLILEYGLIEHNKFNGFVYGIPLSELETTMSKGTAVLLIDPHGVKVISEALYGKATIVVVFIVPENYEQLWERIKNRENPEQRLSISRDEIESAPRTSHYYLFNPVIYNNTPGLPQAQNALRKLVHKFVGK